jgi:type IV pilus assembly protein PilB
VRCAGFVQRDALPRNTPASVPQSPPPLKEFFRTRHAVLYRPAGSPQAFVGTSQSTLAEFRAQLALLLDQPVALVYVPQIELDRIREELGIDPTAKAAAAPGAGKGQEVTDYQDESGPVVQLVNLTLLDAVQKGASDIHIEPFEKNCRIRFRIDGVLTIGREYPPELHSAIISRVKLMAGMDIAERRIPQDGRIEWDPPGGEPLDLRVSSIPTNHGESIVARLLARGSVKADLEKGGFRPEVLAALRQSFRSSFGIVLVSGPTGSGKTTTLYGMVAEVNDVETKIFTIEDPIEYQLDGIVQIPVKEKIGMTFAAGLRAALRQDPDMILIGEMRDEETAEIGTRAALTGHVVFSTIHTNSAPSTLTRLVDMKLKPYLVAATVRAVLAQRLVRKLCPKCARSVEPTPEVRAVFEKNGVPLSGPIKEAAGCDACHKLGYRGRMGVHEFMAMSTALGEALDRAATDAELREIAIKEGMKPLVQDGLIKVAQGLTTMEEVAQITA